MTRQILIFAIAAPILAQSVPSFTPLVLEKETLTPATAAAMLPSRRARLQLPREHWLRPVSATERAGVRMKDGLVAAGAHRALDPGLIADGEWSRGEGRAVWRLALVSPGATAVRVHFRDFDAGDGQVWLHNDNPADPHVSGPYTGRGIFGDGEFWAAPVHGERVVIEYAAAAGSDQLPFEISEISHLWDPIVESSGAREAALPCMVDISCHPEWAARASSVARILFETSEGSGLCSGTLLNTANNSRIPYFATANHCVSTAPEARSVVAYWGYQTARCNGAPPPLNSLQRSTGATLLATVAIGEGPDFSMLRLTSAPNNVTFAGWNATEFPVGTDVTGMHHPDGDFRRVSFGTRIEDQLARGLHNTSFYSIQWNLGTTQGGSSGSGIFNAAGELVGTLFGAPKAPAGKTKCDIIPNFSWYGKFSSAFPLVRQFLEDRGGGTQPPPPSTGGTLLTSGIASRFSITEVSEPTLFSGNSGFRIVVPQNATRLEINVGADPASADLDLFVSRGSEPTVANGRLVADYRSTGPTGNESLVITQNSSPPLQAGTYFIAIGLLTTGVPVNVSITATVSTAAPPPPSGAIALVSGQARPFVIEPVLGAQLVPQQYRIDVPQGAGRVEFRLESSTANVDLDLFVRRGAPIDLVDGRPVYDHASTTRLSNEVITVTTGSSPPLAPGTYYAAIAIFTPGIRVNATLLARVEQGGGPTQNARPLQNGSPNVAVLPPVASARLLTGGEQVYAINVGQGATRLEVLWENLSPLNANVDFVVRRGSVPAVAADGSVIADYRSVLFDNTKKLEVTPTSNPPLTGGVYYVAFFVSTLNTEIRGRITASIVGGAAGPPPPDTTPIALTPGTPQAFNYDPVQNAVLVPQPFRIDVPQGATRLRIQVNTTTPNADVDLFVRFNQAPVVAGDGRVTADHASTGDAGAEAVAIDASTNPALRAGSYFISLGLFTRGVRIQGTVTATIETAVQRPAQATVLTSGTPAKYALPARSDPTLFTGDYGFRIVVPEGATNLTIRLNTANASDVDVDLYVRKDADVDLADDIVADYFSEGPDGNESLVITRDSNPPLTPGTYYIGFVLYPTTRDVTGSITATVERAPTTAPLVGQALNLGETVELRLPAVANPALLQQSDQLRVAIPGPGRLQVRLSTEPSNADVDLYVRYGQPITLDANGRPIRDAASEGDTGNETVTIDRTRSGNYYIALGLFTRNTPVTCTLIAEFTPSESTSAGPRYRWKRDHWVTRVAEKQTVDKGPLVQWIE